MQNRINAIKKTDGTWAINFGKVVEAFLEFYHNLLGSNSVTKNIEPRIIAKGHILFERHHHVLNLNFTPEDIKAALFSIPDNKAPGLDGYSSCSYKKSWEIVGQDITTAVTNFFRNGKILKEINVTAITLIPKISSLEAIGDYRPIACCSILYKIITKLIFTQLGKILHEIVSKTQGALIPRRNIISNILLCHDLVKRFSNKKN